MVVAWKKYKMNIILQVKFMQHLPDPFFNEIKNALILILRFNETVQKNKTAMSKPFLLNQLQKPKDIEKIQTFPKFITKKFSRKLLHFSHRLCHVVTFFLKRRRMRSHGCMHEHWFLNNDIIFPLMINVPVI